MKKALSLILILFLFLNLCACNGSDAEPTQTVAPATESTAPTEALDFSGVTVSMLVYAAETQNNKWLCQQIEEKFGCSIEIIAADPHSGDSYQKKLAELLESGNLPTLFHSTSNGFDPIMPIDQLVALGEQGKLVDILAPENLAQMPNFAKLFIEDEAAHQDYMITAAEDGSHYLLPTYDSGRPVNHFWIYNETAFQKAGVQWRGDPEGFLEMLRELKAYYPNSWPMTGGAWSGICDRTIYTWGVNSSYAAYNWDKGEWYFGATDGAYYEMLQMFQTAYNEKLMSPDCLVSGSGSIQVDIINHESFLYNSWLGWMTMHNAAFEDGGLDDHEIPAPTPVGPNGMTLELKKFSNTEGIFISSRDPRAAACAMKILDWMYDTSEDGGAWLNTVGPDEALTTDENGRYHWKTEWTNDLNEMARKYGMFLHALTVRYCQESPYYTYSSEEEYLAQQIGAQIGYFKAPPMFVISDDLIARIYESAKKDIQDMQVDFIYENWTRAQFDNWVTAFIKEYRCVLDYLNEQF